MKLNPKVILLIIMVSLLIWGITYYLQKNIHMFSNENRENFVIPNIKNKNAEIIPKNIIQVWIDFDKKLGTSKEYPKHYNSYVKSVKRINPTFNYMFFNETKIENFLKTEYPEYYVTYTKLPVNIQKVDFFRYIAMYHYGGFYFDLDITALEPLDELVSYECVFPIDNFINPDMCSSNRYKEYCKKNMDFLLGQYAFGAKPRHSFFRILIDGIHKNIDQYIHTFKTQKYEVFEDYVYETTGPDYVTTQYMNYGKKESITILEYPERQYFGKYARHSYKGSWKENTEN